MPVESAADRAAFFNPDEFGEPVRYCSPAGTEVGAVAVWDRPAGTADFGNTEVNLDVHRFTFRRAEVPTPEQGAVVTVIASGEAFQVIREPQPSLDGALWMLSAAPAA